MTTRTHSTPPTTGAPRLRTAGESLPRGLRSGVGALLSLLVFGLVSACGDRVVGWPSVDTDAPTITATSPESDATNVPLGSVVSATFSEEMEPSTLNEASFRVRRGDTGVQGTVTYAGTTAMFMPSSPLQPNVVYVATVSRTVTDLAGNAMGADYAWSFTSAEGVDNVRPMVSATDPQAGAVNVARNTNISATFTEPMNPATLTASTFLLRDGATEIPGTVTYTGVVATFRPTSPLEEGTVYTARITSQAADLAGNTLLADVFWQFTTGSTSDTTRPQVSSTLPARNAVDVASNASVSATFSEPMDPQSISTGTFTLLDGNTTIFGTVSYSGLTATFVPESPLADETVITARIRSDVQDLSGNELGTDYTWTFTTGTAPDVTPPRVTFTSPANGALNASFNSAITATFSEAMRSATITAASYQLFDGPTLVAGSVGYAGVTATLTPTEPLEAFTTYTVRISDDVEDLAGNEMGMEYVWSFTTGFVPDTTAPTIVGTEPNADAEMVPINSKVTATFSEPMNPQSINTVTFVLSDGTDEVAGAVTYTGTTATFTPAAPLDPMSTYTATVRAEVTDLAGNAMGMDQSWSFETGETPDTQGPSVVSTDPGDGETDAPVTGNVAAVFDEPMDAATITTATFTVEHSGTQVAGTVTYNGAVAIFYPTSSLEALTTYTATMSMMASDLAGNAMDEDYVWTFTTGEAGDTTPPEVTSTMPARDAIDVAPNASISATFTEAMEPLSITTATFTVFDGADPVYGAVSYSGLTATFVPESPLAEETLFTVTLGSHAQDLAGNRMVEDYTWTFTTGTAPDITPPQVTFTSPANGALNAPFNASVMATFSEAMQASTVTDATFQIFDGPTLLASTVSYAGVTATLNPDAPLEAFTTYTVRISGDVEDLAGNAMGADYVWSFTTGIVPDTTLPTILSTTPMDGENSVPPNTKVTATFSESMDAATINTTTFVLSDGTDPVAGAVTYTGQTATFTPAAPLDPMHTYTATMMAEVADLAGNEMGTALSWSFVTGPTPDTQAPSVSFTIPEDGDIDASVTGMVSVVFNEPMDAATLTIATFTVEHMGAQIAGTVTYDGAIAIFHPAASLEAFGVYTATVSSMVADLAGNTMVEDYTWTFTTGAAGDTTPPEVTSTLPARDALNVATNASLSATFTEAMDSESITTATFTLFDGATPVYGAVTYNGVTATFVPENPLADATLFTATIGSHARDLAGNRLVEDYTWTFTTGVSPDVTPPSVTFTSPSNGALNAPYNAPIAATFSEAMEPGGLSSTTFRLFDGATLLASSVVYAGVTATLTADAPLEAFTTYTVRISGDVEDLAGNAMGEEYVWSFTTGAVPDTTPPTLVSTSPAPGEILVPPNTMVSATFSEPMDSLTINTATFVLFAGADQVAGTVTYTGQTATFTPATALDPMTTYTATMRVGVTDLAGNALVAEESWSFETGPTPDTQAPTVVLTDPVDGGTDAPVTGKISVFFDEPMDAATLTTASFTLDHLGVLVSGTVTYDGVVAIFHPTDTLEALSTYTATVTTLAADLAGNTLEEDYVWAFSTGEAGDTTPSEVASTLPAEGAIDVAANASISATFTEEMEPLSITTASFTLFDGATPVYGAVTYTGLTATFVPENPLADSTLFTATIGNHARDLAGNQMVEDYTWTFTTGVAPDVTPPLVVSTSPENGEIDAPFDAPITATFNEEMLATTLSTDSFRLFAGSTLLAGSVSYDGMTATFAMDEPLEAFTTYTVRISGDVEDLAGNVMGDDYVWSFTTGFVPDTTPPTIVMTAPMDEETLVVLNAEMTVTFSEAMDPLTIGIGTFVLFDGLDPVLGTVSYDGITATFSPTEALNPLTTYTATVLTAVTDLAGNAMDEDYTWTFETGPIPDTTRPRVTFTVPEHGATGVSVNSSISAIFTETMDASTLTTASFSIQQLDTVVMGTVSFTGLTATFQPSAALEPMTNYTAKITTMATDLAGNALLQDYIWNFRTGIAPDTSRPSVLFTEPEHNEIDVQVNTAITVVFSEPMDALTLDDENFFVEDELGFMVDGTVTLLGSTAVFTPVEDLDAFTEYTVLILEDASDLSGNTLAEDYVWIFTTGPELDTTAPFVDVTNPQDGESNVPLNTSVSATFSEPMDPLTIHNVSFEVTGPGSSLIEGTVVYDVAQAIATFRPMNDLLADTFYTATITTEATDLAGNPMLMDHVWTFFTGDLADRLMPVDLGTLGTFVAAAGAGITNSNSAGTTTLNGDVALSPTGTCVGDGSPCTITNPVINGTLYANDPAGIAAQAKNDLVDAYVDAMSRPPGTLVADLSGMVLPPGVYTSASTISIAVGGTVTLDGQGDANAVWIFQAGSAITINNNAEVITINGARAANVFWAAGSSSTLGSNVIFQGNILAHESNSVGTGSTVLGRLLCTIGAITFLSNTITLPPR